MAIPRDYKKALTEHILPAGFIHDKFITQNQRALEYSYEDYLRELLNHSSWFMRKTNKQAFAAPFDESNGECDAITSAYAIDFKRILGQSMQYAKGQTASRIDTNGHGATYYMTAKGAGEYQGIRVHAALRKYTKCELDKILIAGATCDLEKDIVAFLQSIICDKNVLLFYPAVFHYSGDFTCSASDICEIIYLDYAAALELRAEKSPGYETYLAFLSAKQLQIGQYTGNGLEWVDGIPIQESKTFNWLRDIYFMDSISKYL